MPKITTKEFKVAGKNYTCGVWYTASDKFFLKEFPEHIQRTAQITPFGSTTEEELYERYREGITRYETLIAQCKKVIVFRISAAEPHRTERYTMYRYATEDAAPVGVTDLHNEDMGFAIAYEIKMLRTVGEDSFLHDEDEEGKPRGNGEKIHNKRYSKIIDYTSEREAAFKDLYLRFDKMLMAFINGFSEPEKFLESIPTLKLLQ